MTSTLPGFPDDRERNRFNDWFREEFAKAQRELEQARTPRLALIATKGSLDWAYPPFILASTAAALGWEVSIFFSFYGLELLKRNPNLGVTPLGNPAMPMKFPAGPQWLRNINWNIPNAITSNLPGFETLAKTMFHSTLKQKGIASIEELRSACVDSGVKLIACQMTVDLFGFEKRDFIPEIHDWVGAASFLPVALRSDTVLFI